MVQTQTNETILSTRVDLIATGYIKPANKSEISHALEMVKKLSVAHQAALIDLALDDSPILEETAL